MISLFLFFFHISSALLNKKVILSKENRPNFKDLKDTTLNIDNKFRKLDTFSSQSFNKESRTERSYLESVVYITSTSFTECFSYGSTYFLGCGGAIFLCNSQLSIKGNTLFTKNSARVGGAIGLYASNVFIEGSSSSLVKFTSNKADFLGGAIFSTQGDSDDMKAQNFFQISFCDFTGNEAKEISGAVCIYSVFDSWIDHCIFDNNRAQHLSGALGFYNCQGMFVFKSTFVNNTSGHRAFIHSNSFQPYQLKSFRKLNHLKGGGGIFVQVKENTRKDLTSDDYRAKLVFATQHCFFANNTCDSKLRTEPYNQGFDILFGGIVTYQSYTDIFLNVKNVSLGGHMNTDFIFAGTTFYDQDTEWDTLTSNINQFFMVEERFPNLKSDIFDKLSVDKYEWPPTAALTDIPAGPVNNDAADSIDNNDLPANTAPATKLPERTTRGGQPAASTILPEWHVSSVSRTVHYVSPSMSPTESPTESATESATESPTESPTESATESPTESPTESATESATESPTESPTESATESATESPTESPTESATESATESPTESPTESATESATESPTESPTESATESPTESPSLSPTESATQSATRSPSLSPSESATSSATESPSISATESATESPSLSSEIVDDNLEVEKDKSQFTTGKTAGLAIILFGFIVWVALVSFATNSIYKMKKSRLEDPNDDNNGSSSDRPETRMSNTETMSVVSMNDTIDDPFAEDFDENIIQICAPL